MDRKGGDPMKSSHVWKLSELISWMAAQNKIPALSPRESETVRSRLAKALGRDEVDAAGIETEDWTTAPRAIRGPAVDSLCEEEGTAAKAALLLLETMTILGVAVERRNDEGSARTIDLCWIFTAIYRKFGTQLAA